jgi:integrase
MWLRERAKIIVDALTEIRRSELLGLKWKDVDFIGVLGRIVRTPPSA